jgi:hypothetical protein
MIAKGEFHVRASPGRSDTALLNELSSKSQRKINLPATFSDPVRGKLYLLIAMMVIA